MDPYGALIAGAPNTSAGTECIADVTFLIGVTNEKGDNWKLQDDPERPGYFAIAHDEAEAQAFLDKHKIATPHGWKLCERSMYVGEDGYKNYGQIASDANARIASAKAAENTARCPKCKSESIHAEKRGWNLLTGFIGSGKVAVTCLKCGHRFAPGRP